MNNKEEQIRAEIFKNGPVVGGMEVYTDFFHYKSGKDIKKEKIPAIKCLMYFFLFFILERNNKFISFHFLIFRTSLRNSNAIAGIYFS